MTETRPDIHTHALYAQTERGTFYRLTQEMPYGAALRRHANVVDGMPEDSQTVVLPAVFIAPEGPRMHREKVVALVVRPVAEVVTGWGSTLRDAKLECYTARSFSDSDLDEVRAIEAAEAKGTEVIWHSGYRIHTATVSVPFVR